MEDARAQGAEKEQPAQRQKRAQGPEREAKERGQERKPEAGQGDPVARLKQAQKEFHPGGRRRRLRSQGQGTC
jgi:hypothetical protein